MAQILVVDDEVGIRELLSEILSEEGHSVRLAEDANAARLARNQERPDMVLLDIWMPDTDGITLLKEWAANGQLNMPVVMMSGHATVDTAVEATRIGAQDFLEKPISLQKLLATVVRVLRHQEAQVAPALTLAAYGRSTVLRDFKKRLEQVARVGSPLLLRGEPGCLIELSARHTHQPSTPWVAVGAKSNATPQEFLEQAEGGTLFVEELSALGKAQLKNLAFLLDKLDKHRVQLVVGTTTDPAKLSEFGIDVQLLKKLSGLWLTLPSLREHADDVPEIASLLLAQMIENRESPQRNFSTAALNALRNYHWPGNHEQLKSVVRNLALTALETEVDVRDVQRVLGADMTPEAPTPLNFDLPLREAREAFETAYFEHHLALEKGNMTRIAERTGLERTHLYRKIKQLGIDITRKNSV
jgi:two-component system, NtrC family, nitrogen regulation response regulator NtrX